MRAKGLRPKVFWLPDVKDPAWKAEAARQSRLAAASDRRSGDQDFVDSLVDWDGWPPA